MAQAFQAGNPFPYVRSYTNPTYTVGAVYMPVPPNLKTPEVYNWNLTLQRQVSAKLFASAAYVGTEAIHLWDAVELNPAVFMGLGSCTINTPTGAVTYPVCSTTGNTNARRVLNLQNPVKAQYISNLTAFDDGATSNYNGLLLSTAWRATKTVSINANYTWSHCIGDQKLVGRPPSLNPAKNYIHAERSRSLDRGNCSAATASSDRRNAV